MAFKAVLKEIKEGTKQAQREARAIEYETRFNLGACYFKLQEFYKCEEVYCTLMQEHMQQFKEQGEKQNDASKVSSDKSMAENGSDVPYRKRFSGRDYRLFMNKALCELVMGRPEQSKLTCKAFIEPVKVAMGQQYDAEQIDQRQLGSKLMKYPRIIQTSLSKKVDRLKRQLDDFTQFEKTQPGLEKINLLTPKSTPHRETLRSSLKEKNKLDLETFGGQAQAIIKARTLRSNTVMQRPVNFDEIELHPHYSEAQKTEHI